jgi:hypothetical protein
MLRELRRRLALLVSCALAFAFVHAASAVAQPRAHVVVTTPTAAAACSVSVVGVLTDEAFDELMRNGFPVRMHIRAELWRTGGIFDQLTAHTEWEIVVSFDSFDATYEVVRVTFDDSKARFVPLGTYKLLASAQAAAELAYAPQLPSPPKGREAYIAVQADVQTMDMSDLDELQRWLRGEARPAVQGRKNPGKVITRGLSSIVTRLLGAEVRHYEGRSKRFVL